MSIDNVAAGTPILVEWGNSVADELNRVSSAVASVTSVINLPDPGPTDVTGVAVTVTVPADRRILVGFDLHLVGGASDMSRLSIVEGAATLKFARVNEDTADVHVTASVILTPTVGAHTYKLVHQKVTGTVDVVIGAEATAPTQMWAYDLGPAV